MQRVIFNYLTQIFRFVDVYAVQQVADRPVVPWPGTVACQPPSMWSCALLETRGLRVETRLHAQATNGVAARYDLETDPENRACGGAIDAKVTLQCCTRQLWSRLPPCRQHLLR